MAKVIRIGIQDVIVTPTGKPTNIFWRALEQVFTVVTAFSDLDGTTNDISQGDVNRFRELADIVISRDIDGNVSEVAKNGKTTTITRDVNKAIETVVEVVDATPTMITTQTIVRDINNRAERVNVNTVGFPEN